MSQSIFICRNMFTFARHLSINNIFDFRIVKLIPTPFPKFDIQNIYYNIFGNINLSLIIIVIKFPAKNINNTYI